jgi:UDP-2,4-diacetamido-2,4,6-trideoxy-beta-L-altropyranose hydrolase
LRIQAKEAEIMSYSPPRLYIRSEASSSLGMGHFMRCFAIAEQARSRGYDITFLLNEITSPMLARLRDINAQSVSLSAQIGTKDDVRALATHLHGKPTLIVDSYKVTAPYLHALCGLSTVVLMDDNCTLEPMPCHVVINASIAAFDMPYETVAPQALRLIGPNFAAIRKEFRGVEPVDEGYVAVMFGGSDTKGYSLKAAHMVLTAIPDIEVRIICGPGLIDMGALKVLASTEPRVKLMIAPPSVADALKGARLVVTAAGTSVSEIAAMGLMAISVVVVENQMASMSACPFPVLDGRITLPADLGEWVSNFYEDTNTRECMARAAHEIIDGEGCKRILEELKSQSVAVQTA